jgi:hypothetical protein
VLPSVVGKLIRLGTADALVDGEVDDRLEDAADADKAAGDDIVVAS